MAAHALGDNYPWPNADMKQYSPLRFAYRNCTDYAAWTINAQLGGTVNDIRFDWDDIQHDGSGHARNWKQGAINRRKPVNDTPAKGAVAWWGANYGGGFGHVAIVADVRDGGNTITVHEYNRGWDGKFGSRTLIRSNGWPEAFLHLADINETPPTGTDTFGTYNPATATYYISNAMQPSTAEATFMYGNTGWIPLVGDWDGDGTDTSVPARNTASPSYSASRSPVTSDA